MKHCLMNVKTVQVKKRISMCICDVLIDESCVIFNNVWCMPSKNTFTIKPINDLIKRYIVHKNNNWIDPMAGNHSFAEITNDINPETSAIHHLDAMDFIELLKKPEYIDGVKIPKVYHGVLFDPPYSPRQVSEMYNGFGGKATSWDTTMSYYSKLKDAISPIIGIGGHAISFGWNSTGFGKCRGFKTIEILLVKHGGWHNDTIVTVEQKICNVKKI